MTDQHILSSTGLSRNGLGAERRAFVRHACSWTISCYSVLPAEDSRWPATICDVSNCGLRLVAYRPFKKGDIIALELIRPLDGLRDKLFGRIQHVTGEGGVWIAGCRFVNRLNDQEIERLCETPTALSVNRSAQRTGRGEAAGCSSLI